MYYHWIHIWNILSQYTPVKDVHVWSIYTQIHTCLRELWEYHSEAAKLIIASCARQLLAVCSQYFIMRFQYSRFETIIPIDADCRVRCIMLIGLLVLPWSRTSMLILTWLVNYDVFPDGKWYFRYMEIMSLRFFNLSYFVAFVMYIYRCAEVRVSNTWK
jgi:hypothetical protein